MTQTCQEMQRSGCRLNPVQGFCRCCHKTGDFRRLTELHNNSLNENQSYRELLQETFNIYLKLLESSTLVPDRICDPCVLSLLAAASFRNQVLQCENKLIESQVKVELPSTSSQVHINKKTDSDNESLKSDDKPLIELQDAPTQSLETSHHQKTKVRRRSKRQVVTRLECDDEGDDVQQDCDDVQDQLAPDGKRRSFACNLCEKKFTFQGYLDAHYRKHTGEKAHKCEICQNTFQKNKELTKHIEISHVQNDKYPCVHCTNVFITAQLLKKHLTIHSTEKQHQCRECQKKFKSKRGLSEHLQVHTGVKKYKCHLCQKSFGYNQTLKTHLLIHSGERPHTCDVCGRGFHQSTHLKRHIRLIHTGVKPHQCQVCQKQFTSKSYLRVHERQHTGVKPYSCEYCLKPFTAYTTLKVHLRIHTGIKPYTCSICSRTFAQISSYRIHERSHTGQKPFSCEVCKKSFSDNGYLKIHLRSHSDIKPYSCEICQKSFKESGKLKKHSLTHTGRKRFTCKVCNKQIGNLYKHMRIHSGKGYTCQICQKQFAANKNLKLHLEDHKNATTTPV